MSNIAIRVVKIDSGRHAIRMNQYVLARIQALQDELERLKKTIIYCTGKPKRKTKLKGLWKGIEIDETDIKEAQRALFRSAYEFKE